MYNFKVQMLAEPRKIAGAKMNAPLNLQLHHFYTRTMHVFSELFTSRKIKGLLIKYLQAIAFFAFYLRGPDQIRTGVGAFAELSLATRPRNQLSYEVQIVIRTSQLVNLIILLYSFSL